MSSLQTTSFQLQRYSPPSASRRSFPIPLCQPDRRCGFKRQSLILRRDLRGWPSKTGQRFTSKAIHQGVDSLIKFQPFIQRAVVHKRARKNVCIESSLEGGSGTGLITMLVTTQPATKFHINNISHLGSNLSLISSCKNETSEKGTQGVGPSTQFIDKDTQGESEGS